MISSVERGSMLRQVRGLGVLVAGDNGRLKAAVQIAETQAKDLQIGQPASIDTRLGMIPGKVMNISPAVTNGLVTVDVSLEGNLPRSAKAGLNVDGLIEIERLDDVLYVGRPASVREGSVFSLFKLEEGGATATKVQVKFGKSSVTVMEILEGLNVGDKVIISDMSGYAGVNSIRLN
jgi:HlyD family secretion protein